MKNPKYMEEFFALIFLILGIAFSVTSALCVVGILKPTAHSSVQSPNIMGMIFLLVGITFCAAQTVFRIIAYKKARWDYELTEKGTKLIGNVEKVYLQSWTQFGKKSPYRIFYTYSYQNIMYHHKSCLLWNTPNFNAGDSIEIYVNDLGKSTPVS